MRSQPTTVNDAESSMIAMMLIFKFIYNQFMILDDKSFRKCVCVFAATLTRSNINLEFVYSCITVQLTAYTDKC